MFAEERQQDILRILQRQNKVSVQDLSHRYQVSKTTIRADLKVLEENALIVKTHGGAMLKSYSSFEMASEKRKSINQEKKQVIGQLAAELVQDNETILLDTGTTVLQLALALKDRKNLTVVTNDMDIAKTLEEYTDIQIVMLGGMVKKGYHCTYQLEQQGLIQQLNIDKAFMACNAFSWEYGAMVADINLAETKRRMVSRCQQRILLCDTSKIGQSALAHFIDTAELDVLVSEAAPAEAEKFRELGIELVYPA